MPIRPARILNGPKLEHAGRPVVDDFAKILAFAASAGKTLTYPEALDVIKAIARAHVVPSPVSEAIARHVRRCADLINGSPEARELVAEAARGN